MTTQYTPTLKLALPVTGELSGTWGDVVNDNITSMIEQAIAGLATINTWTGNAHTLTTANGTTSESRCAMLVAATGGGAPSAAAEIICPAAAKLYVLQNNTSYAVTLKTSAGTGVAVAAGDTAFLFCDGTNVNSCVTTIVNGHITGNLTVDGNATINGNTTLGNATSDTVTVTARVASNVLPSADNTYDLGSTGNSWKDLYIDGTATMALVAISGGTINGVSIGATTPATFLAVDNLSLDGNTIASTNTNGNIVIAPNGTGDVQLDADTVRVGDSGAAVTVTSNGAGALTVTTGGAADLTLSTNSGATTGTITIANGANGNITLTPDGTGDVILSADRVQIGDANTDATLTTNGTGNLNLTTNNGTNSGTIQIAQGANGNITLTPNGTGSVSISKLYSSGNTTLGATSANTLSVAALVNSNLLFTDATYDIGATGANRPRDMFLSRNLTVGGTLTLAGGVNLNGNVTIGDASSDTLTINSTITSNLIFTDNTYDIGASGATRPRNFYLAGNEVVGGTSGIAGTLFKPEGSFIQWNSTGASGGTNRGIVWANSSGNLYLGTGSGNSTVATFDSSGNTAFGGVTPSAWAATYGGVQFGYSTTRASALFTNGVDDTWFVSNAYFNGTNWVKFASGTASAYEMYGGIHKWYSYGTAGTGTFNFGSATMELSAAGNLTLGASTSQAKLNVVTGLSGTYGSAAVWISDNATTSMLINNTSSGVSSIWASGALTFGAGSNNNAEAGRFDSTGNFLVGTTNNYAVGATNWVMSKSGYVFAADNTGSANNRNWLMNVNGSAAGSLDFVNSSANNTWPNAAYIMSLTRQNNVLIGTTTDQGRRLIVSGTFAIVDSALNTIADMTASSTGELSIRPYYGPGSTITLGTNPSGGGVTERVRIASTGYVGINNNNPSTRLAVSLNTNEAASITSYSDTSGAVAANQGEIRELGFNVNSSANFVISSVATTSTGWRVVFRGTWSNNYEGGGLTFYAPYIELNAANPSTAIGSRTLTVSRNGSGYLIVNSGDAYYISFAGTVEIYQNPQSTQPSQSMRLLGGIQFPATQNTSSNANTLDDYEEGTFTPTITADSSNPTISYTYRDARYTKIGNAVYIDIYLMINTTSGGSGGVNITGLPFSVAAGSTNAYPLTGWASNTNWNANYTNFVPVALYGGTTIWVTLNSRNQGYTKLDASNLAAGNEWRITGFYFTD